MNIFQSHSNYQIKRKINKGYFGTVFEVLNKDDNKIYALKQIPINFSVFSCNNTLSYVP